MKLNNKVILSLLAMFSMIAILFGTANAQGSSGSPPGENLAMRSPALSTSALPASTILERAPISSYCFNCLPRPRLVYTGREGDQYNLAVANSDDYPASLFKAASDLPPCGLNTNSARTWVEIYNSNGDYIYGFCALSGPSDLKGLWFAVPDGESPPDSVYITLNDRRCNIILKSNPVAISLPAITTRLNSETPLLSATY